MTLKGTDENGGRGAGRQAGRPEVGASAGQLPSMRRALSVGLLAASRFSPRLKDDARAALLSAPVGDSS